MRKQNSRIQHHRLTTAGYAFTVPGTEDFTDGSWSTTDLMIGEIGINITDDTIYARTINGIVQIPVVGTAAALWKRVGDDIVPIDTGASPVVYPNIIPDADNVSDLGTASLRWQNLRLGGMCVVAVLAGSAIGALPAEKGAIVFNDSTGKFQGYDGSTWKDFY